MCSLRYMLISVTIPFMHSGRRGWFCQSDPLSDVPRGMATYYAHLLGEFL